MKILIEKNSLVQGLSQVQRAIATKNTLPILSGVLLEAQENQITFTASDQELTLSSSVEAQVQEPGKILLPARNLLELAKRFPPGTVSISLDPFSPGIKINYGHSEIVLNSMDSDQFPTFPLAPEQNLFSINSQDLKNMIKRVSISISPDHARPVFSGALFEKNSQGILSMASTDTHRLSVVKQEGIPFFSENSLLKMLIPGRTLNELFRLIEEDDLVHFGLVNNQLLVSFGRTILISRLIDGQFPNYQQVIPTEWCSKVIIDTQIFLEAVERASLIAREENKNRTNFIMLELKTGFLEIDSNSPEIGRIHEEIPAICDGEDMKIIFNAKYLLDGLKVMETEQLTIKFTGPSSAAVLMPKEENNFIYLLLPIRIQ
ncbi:MAG: DNA polymerase III subunit beta [Bacillota bacterium]